jgi:hypothetical protein
MAKLAVFDPKSPDLTDNFNVWCSPKFLTGTSPGKNSPVLDTFHYNKMFSPRERKGRKNINNSNNNNTRMQS